jgi:outer membrane protein OmpU
MTNLKKIGLSALAGSLVAFSAQAGSLDVSGGAKFTYTGDTGAQDAEADGNRFGMQHLMSFTGGGELDNGHTIALYHGMTSNGGKSSSSLTYDMGAMGALTYNQDSGDLGIGKIDDIMPTADEEVWNGLSAVADSGATAVAPNGRVDSSNTGFNYAYTMGTTSINVGYGVKGQTNSNDDGANSGAGAVESATSIGVSMTPIDGLRIVAGTGEKGATDSTSNDHTTYGFTYATSFGLTVGAQQSEIDFAAAGTKDLETDMYGVSFAVNDDLSISYGSQETTADGDSDKQKVTGVSVGYSMGSMTIKAHQNKGENIAQVADIESEHTEVAISFAF